MADHQIVERVERTGSGSGMIVGMVAVVVLVAVVTLFMIMGGPARLMGSTPSQTNVNVPSQPQQPSGPQINIPRQIDVNVNQPAPQAPQVPQIPVTEPGR
jgi:hypothetical protein